MDFNHETDLTPKGGTENNGIEYAELDNGEVQSEGRYRKREARERTKLLGTKTPT